jgi:hypothetical protein
MPTFSVFEYDEREQTTDTITQYFRCTLISPLGQFNVGETFTVVEFVQRDLALYLYRYGSEHFESEQILVGVVQLGVVSVRVIKH